MACLLKRIGLVEDVSPRVRSSGFWKSFGDKE